MPAACRKETNGSRENQETIKWKGSREESFHYNNHDRQPVAADIGLPYHGCKR